MPSGIYERTPEMRKRISDKLKSLGIKPKTSIRGNKLSEEHRHKLSLAHQGRPLSEQHKRALLGRVPWNKGAKMSKDFCQKMSKARLGRRPWNKGMVGYKSGDQHYNWRGGITPINEGIRKSTEYKLWRRSVFERDRYVCVWCKQANRVIHADHIKPFSLYPELRFAIDNGRTLCVDCHKTTKTYGVQPKTNHATKN